jgi:hypothetical protein
MATESIDGLSGLLAEAEAAHGVFETTALNGVYDQDWPRWYAGYAVDHGIGELLGHPISADELGRFLAGSWAEYGNTEPKPTDPWTTYTARRIAAEL